MPSVTAADRRDERLARVALLFVFVLMACLALRQVSSGDVGFHLAAGGYVLDGHGWPRTDPFTFTVTDHLYVDTSWGYQVVLTLLERVFGAPGLVLFHAGCVILLLWLVHRTARLRSIDCHTLVLLLWLGGLASEMRYDVRPELVSYVLLALVLHLLHRHAEGLGSPIWLLPLIFLVWVNTHSLFVLGWIALVCFTVGLMLRDRRPDWRLVRWSVVSVAVTIVNPYGLRGVLFPLVLATRFEEANPFHQAIGEFKSPFALGLSEQFPFYPRVPIFSFRVFFVLSALALIPLLRRKHWCGVLLWAPFAYLSFSMVRNIPLLVIAVLPAVAWGVSLEGIASRVGIPAGLGRRLLRGATVAVAVCSLLLTLRVVHDGYYVASRRQDRWGIGWNPLTQPVAATAYAERTGLEGRVLNHLNFGGYLMWARAKPVFIDGRLEVIGEDFFERYRQALSEEPALEATVAQYGIEWMVFPYRLAPRLLQRLTSDPRWSLAYVDPLAVVFVRTGTMGPRRVDPTVEALNRPAATPTLALLPGVGGQPRPGPIGRWLAGLVRRERFPTEPFYLGLFHYWRGETARAAARFAEAVEASDGAYYETYQNLGSALFRLGRYAEARDCYRVVLEDAPRNRLARERLAETERRLEGRPVD